MRKKIKREGKFYVYIVECSDDTYYTGSTNNIGKRIKEHNNSKRGAKYLRGKGPIKLAWYKQYRYYARALQAEIRIKRLSHRQKYELTKTYERTRK